MDCGSVYVRVLECSHKSSERENSNFHSCCGKIMAHSSGECNLFKWAAHPCYSGNTRIKTTFLRLLSSSPFFCHSFFFTSNLLPKLEPTWFKSILSIWEWSVKKSSRYLSMSSLFKWKCDDGISMFLLKWMWRLSCPPNRPSLPFDWLETKTCHSIIDSPTKYANNIQHVMNLGNWKNSILPFAPNFKLKKSTCLSVSPEKKSSIQINRIFSPASTLHSVYARRAKKPPSSNIDLFGSIHGKERDLTTFFQCIHL